VTLIRHLIISFYKRCKSARPLYFIPFLVAKVEVQKFGYITIFLTSTLNSIGIKLSYLINRTTRTLFSSSQTNALRRDVKST
jgi:hypothetical protein